jgi:hypothetical protein
MPLRFAHSYKSDEGDEGVEGDGEAEAQGRKTDN